MSFVVELVATILGEALFDRISRWVEPLFLRINAFALSLVWLLLPFAEWYAFRIVQFGPSPFLWFVAVSVSLGWPIFALICAIVWFNKRQNPPGSAA